MPAWTASDGENWADEINFVLWFPDTEAWIPTSLDGASGKIIVSTEVKPNSGEVTIWLKSPKDVGLTPCNRQ
jgi:hypothetical protein